jgi:3-hydroxyisobutyrate dehydrogenase-like beta-hydroxyacid dehydrogenase
MMAAVQIAALGEGLALAERAGLDRSVVAQAIGGHAAGSPVVKMKLANAEKRDHSDTHFALRWMHKDVSYAMRLADEVGVSMPTVAITRELLRMAMQRGFADQDLSALTEVAHD